MIRNDVRYALLLGLVALLLAACQPVHPEAAAVAAPPANTVSPSNPVDLRIANALSALPAALAEGAAVIDMNEAGEVVELRAGTNGWICIPDSPGSPGNDPMCMDDVWMQWFDALMTGAEFSADHVGIGYMLQGGSDASNIDPFAMEPAAGEDWITTPPHTMVISPIPLDPTVFTTDPNSGGPYIMWAGTPYEHLMVPVVADVQ